MDNRKRGYVKPENEEIVCKDTSSLYIGVPDMMTPVSIDTRYKKSFKNKLRRREIITHD